MLRVNNCATAPKGRFPQPERCEYGCLRHTGIAAAAQLNRKAPVGAGAWRGARRISSVGRARGARNEGAGGPQAGHDPDADDDRQPPPPPPQRAETQQQRQERQQRAADRVTARLQAAVVEPLRGELAGVKDACGRLEAGQRERATFEAEALALLREVASRQQQATQRQSQQQGLTGGGQPQGSPAEAKQRPPQSSEVDRVRPGSAHQNLAAHRTDDSDCTPQDPKTPGPQDPKSKHDGPFGFPSRRSALVTAIGIVGSSFLGSSAAVFVTKLPTLLGDIVERMKRAQQEEARDEAVRQAAAGRAPEAASTAGDAAAPRQLGMPADGGADGGGAAAGGTPRQAAAAPAAYPSVPQRPTCAAGQLYVPRAYEGGEEAALFELCDQPVPDVAAVRGLLVKGMDINILKEDRTPLMAALCWDDPELVALLLRAGASTCAANEAGLTALHFARSDAAVRMLVQAGASVSARDQYRRTPLHGAAEAGWAAAASALLELGADREANTHRGNTPLHLAAESGHFEAARVLLRAGASPNSLNKRGRTPLHAAALGYHVSVARLLLSAGADRSITDKAHMPPWILAGSGSLTRLLRP